MKSLIRIAVASVLLLAANGAFAQYVNGTEDNTDAGTYVNNVVTVTYEVNSVLQTAVDNTSADGPDPDSDPDGAQFVVDRVIMHTVANTSGDSVTPGQAKTATPPPTLTFTVTNDSNATLDFALTTEDLAGDDFDATGIEIYVDANSNGTYEPATDLATSIDNLAEEGVATVFVIAGIPAVASNTDFDDLVLVATAYEVDGTTIVADDDADNDDVADAANGGTTVETVFGDADGTGTEGAEDGMHSATGRFTVASASISVTKSSTVVSDPFNETTNPKAIPGAVVRYCILVTNAGAEEATDITVSDPIPGGTSFVSGSIVVADDCAGTNGTAEDDNTTDGDDTDGKSGSYDAGSETVSTVVSSLAAPVGPATETTTATIFRVIVD